MTTKRRAIGIIRVSQINGRDGESFASPGEQRERIEAACKRDGLKLVQAFDEMDVSGGTALERRTGLRTAIETIESGQAEVIVAAYFDRLVRSLKVQAELVERVEAAGGEVLALDVGQVTEGTAGQWLSGTMLGAVSEYQRRTTRERTGAAQRRAIERGVPPLANIPPGYRRGEDGRLVVEPREAPIVAEAFKMRAAGSSIKEVCAFMRTHGIERTWRSTQSTLASPIVLGEIHFGEMVNLEAHPAIVDRDTFRRVQKMRVTRGRKAKSERLLAPSRRAALRNLRRPDERRLAQQADQVHGRGRPLPDVSLLADERLPAAGRNLRRARRERCRRAGAQPARWRRRTGQRPGERARR